MAQALLHFNWLKEKVKLITATDFAPGMIEILRQKIDSAEGLASTPIKTGVEDSQALSFESNSFGGVISSFGHFLIIPDRAKAWKEALRVLKPGSVFGHQCVGNANTHARR